MAVERMTEAEILELENKIQKGAAELVEYYAEQDRKAGRIPVSTPSRKRGKGGKR